MLLRKRLNGWLQHKNHLLRRRRLHPLLGGVGMAAHGAQEARQAPPCSATARHRSRQQRPAGAQQSSGSHAGHLCWTTTPVGNATVPGKANRAARRTRPKQIAAFLQSRDLGQVLIDSMRRDV